jgi:hypothetical protein
LHFFYQIGRTTTDKKIQSVVVLLVKLKEEKIILSEKCQFFLLLLLEGVKRKSWLVRRVGFEPTNPCGIGASVLRLWPCWATSATSLLLRLVRNIELPLSFKGFTFVVVSCWVLDLFITVKVLNVFV